MADHDVHNEQFHFSSVNNVCRLCLNLFKTIKESRLYKKKIMLMTTNHSSIKYMVLIWAKTNQAHTQVFFCWTCKLKLDTYIRRNVRSTYNKEFENMWVPYNQDLSTECSICIHLRNLRASGRKFKPTSTASSSPNPNAVSKHIHI